jgi:hypothetical protein
MQPKQEKRIKTKPVIGTLVLCLIVLLAWAGNRYWNKPPAELPNQSPFTVQPPPANAVPQNKPEAAVPPQRPTIEQQSIGSQRHSPDKPMIVDNHTGDLSSHTMSIKREEKKGFQVMPGVNVKSGVVNVQLDENNDRTIEIEKDPDNSTSDYQIMMKKKF